MHPYIPTHSNLNMNNLSIDIIEDLTRMVTDELIDELSRLESETEINLQPATEEQIASLDKKINQDNEDIFCAICQDKIKIGETYSCMPCNTHFYHHNCLEEWLQRDNSCPICRVPIETINNSIGITNDFFITIIFPDRSILYKSFNKKTTIKELIDKINNYLTLNLSEMDIIIKNLSNNQQINYTEIMNDSIEKVNISNGSQIKLIR